MNHTMPMPFASRSSRRSAMTLVELLVVISIIGLLGGIVGLIAPRFAERSRVAQGSSQLRSWLLVAKQRAMRDKAPRGLRFISNTSTPVVGSAPPKQLFYTTFAYVEQPEDISGMPSEIGPANNQLALAQLRGQFQQQVAAQLQTASTNPAYSAAQRAKFAAYKTLVEPVATNTQAWKYLLWLRDKDFSTGTIANPIINDNDIVEFGGARYSVIYKPIKPPNSLPGSILVLHRMRDEFRLSKAQVDNAPLTSYRITRLPQPIAGEPELTLPKNIAVDILFTNLGANISNTRSLPAPDINAPPSTLAYEIIFGPSGEVTGQLASVGRIVLWLRDTTLNDPGPGKLPDGENRLLVIHSRTGQVTAHAVNATPDANGFLADAYQFVRDGKSSALEE